MSSSRIPQDKRPPLQVYRCGDTHWHFIPHKHDFSTAHLPWYRRLTDEEADPGKFHGGQTVYVQGQSGKEFIVLDKFVSGFYRLLHTGAGPVLCSGRYGQAERKMYREEEISGMPWGRERERAPAYEEEEECLGAKWYGC